MWLLLLLFSCEYAGFLSSSHVWGFVGWVDLCLWFGVFGCFWGYGGEDVYWLSHCWIASCMSFRSVLVMLVSMLSGLPPSMNRVLEVSIVIYEPFLVAIRYWSLSGFVRKWIWRPWWSFASVWK